MASDRYSPAAKYLYWSIFKNSRHLGFGGFIQIFGPWVHPVVALADHNFPAVLPSATGKCLCIIRMELGTLEELGNLLLSLFSSLPPGTIILLGSLSQLRLGVYKPTLLPASKWGRKLGSNSGRPSKLCHSSHPPWAEPLTLT
jgi:hypothetical protein